VHSHPACLNITCCSELIFNNHKSIYSSFSVTPVIRPNELCCLYLPSFARSVGKYRCRRPMLMCRLNKQPILSVNKELYFITILLNCRTTLPRSAYLVRIIDHHVLPHCSNTTLRRHMQCPALSLETIKEVRFAAPQCTLLKKC
jgi:hypothetical protein